MPERFRDELLTMGRYTNPASFIGFTFYIKQNSEIAIDIAPVAHKFIMTAVDYDLQLNFEYM